jgi:glycosyltransferase involved in cell wall biosynthesis
MMSLQADIIQFEYPYLLPIMILLKTLRRSFVLDEHGVEYQFIRELKKIPASFGTGRSIGYMLKKTPGLIPIVLAMEKAAIKLCSMVFVCSENDGSEIKRLYHLADEKLVVVPNCADRSLFEEVVPRRFSRPTVLFLGSFDHPPNVEGASVLIHQIVPLVSNKVKDVLFVFVGRNPPQRLLKQQGARILFTGEVEDFRPLVAGAAVAVAPVFSGSGTRTKIVDYMALEKPVVSTSKGAEGLNLKDEEDFLERNTIKGFADGIVELLTNREKAKRLGGRAREVAETQYSWDTQAINVLQSYAKVAGMHVPERITRDR